ncbi:MAG TPA: RcnB family protein [Terracidiphilus sp.]|jgi:Ni/Co efflux regulator RcnB|nr:RcnB family protein [Terracidiphilus sp.]
MKPFFKTLAVSTLALSFACGPALIAQDQDHHGDQRDRHHDQYVRHDEWKRGQHMRHEDWDRGQRVQDWRAHHLRNPPRGYEWRDLDGQYVLATPDGVIFQVIGPR